jgi:hypothetical protein
MCLRRKNRKNAQKVAENCKSAKNTKKESRNFCHPSLVDFGPSPNNNIIVMVVRLQKGKKGRLKEDHHHCYKR